MAKINKNIAFIFGIIILTLANCSKKDEMSNLDKLRNNTNKQGFPVTKMDSAKAIENITYQKLQEILDLSSLYHLGSDSEIDSVIYAQMQSYFSEPDSLKISKLLKTIDSLKCNTVKVSNLSIIKKINAKDTLNFAKFNVEYFDKNKNSLGIFDKVAQFTLKPSPIKFKKEFKFYFIDFNVSIPKDSTEIGVTK